ncbi:Serine/threonine-protein kinase [Wickerhamomyces ciferrii]|uniref:non-specific serine/threonine protein kinase n=1 Tax=Wickerhamomyces ciferrii (strain ATCC 14091 / BCRC 22168 / CBS 111 / JCM 3599 / NBRC 0793 / NRRL Y-1031 F-60-10) TaxID=1206466 RepID=K0KIZ5_WICCF|nr:Serine/threonine-protein kinase [Wickerhamomyces ciferrii]CCH42946.1 Serine/threonine-protein kinase [Wickerhamomyces ciferrii]
MMMNGGRNSNNEKARIAENYNRLYSEFCSDQIKEVGNYTIIKQIGEGSFGKVYLANHKLTHTKVVLKTGNKTDPNLVREIYYHRQFKHIYITRLYEVVVSEGMIWMVLEYCPGKELYDYVLGCGRIPIENAKRLFAQITSAVFYAHSLNCIHRDLKLENILLDKKKNAKLSDFGFTRECEQRNFLETVCGTTVYMAPELIKKEKYDGFKVDVWSLGVILYTMLYGQMPFDEDDENMTGFKIVNTEPIYKEDIPQSAIDLIKRMLNKTPSQRPSTLEILNHPFLENEGLSNLESTLSVLKLMANQKHFHSKSEKHLLKKLKSLGIDTYALQKSVINKKADSLCGLWELLLEKEKKKQGKKYKTRSRSVLRISESTSRRVSQFMDPAMSPPLSRIVSGMSNKSHIFNDRQSNGRNDNEIFNDFSNNNNNNNNNNSNNNKNNNHNNHNNKQEFQDNKSTGQSLNNESINSPGKKKNGFIQKFTKLWKNKKPEISTNHSDYQKTSFDSMNKEHKGNSNHTSPIKNQDTPSHQNNSKLTITAPSFKSSPNTLTIHEPKSPTRSSNFDSRAGRPRPVSMISTQSVVSNMTNFSDMSVGSFNTTNSENLTRPPFTRKKSSDTSLYSKGATARRSLSLISSNSSASDRSSRKGSLYDQSTSSSFTARNNRGRKFNESVFPKTFKRRKSPLGIPPSSKFKRSKAFIIEEEEDSENNGEDNVDVDDDNMEDIETDLENLGIGESTRLASDFESDVSERGRQL